MLKSLEVRKRIVELCEQRKDFLLICHVDADGDAIGSLLGLGLALQKAGKKVFLVSPNGVPVIYRFLPGWRQIHSSREGLIGCGFEVVIVLDTAEPDRMGEWSWLLDQKGVMVVNIDHHRTNSNFGSVNWVEAASSTGELVYELLQELGWEVDRDIALCLYTAIVTDTGSFRFENTSVSTHQIAARLLATGINPAQTSEYIFESKPMPAVRLLGRALQSLELSSDGRIAWITITREDLEAVGATREDVNGIVNFVRGIAGVEVGILFQEAGDNLVKVGLRSGLRVDISSIAQQFGGGGHPRAAGCRVQGSLEEVQKRVLEAVTAVLARGKIVDAGDPQCP